MITISFDVLHDGQKWIARNDEITVSGETLAELDGKIKESLKKTLGKRESKVSEVTKATRVKVTMELDYRRNVPHWIWQYHPYYFYRTIYIDLDKP
ncbi:MAG: DUF5395 family protein [Archaeoglobus sp.]|nr:DUF5395 family protein [Archaeoglobus sp.]